MNNAVRKIMLSLVRQYGSADIAMNRLRFEGLLRDKVGNQHQAEIRVLLISQQANIPRELLANRQRGITHARLNIYYSKRLYRQYAIDLHAAAWAVETWALALNVTLKPSSARPKSQNSAALTNPAFSPTRKPMFKRFLLVSMTLIIMGIYPLVRFFLQTDSLHAGNENPSASNGYASTRDSSPVKPNVEPEESKPRMQMTQKKR